ncbi:MAG: hypothetical protein R6U43_06970 [Candidatus Krumholzibacteriales bacterium]
MEVQQDFKKLFALLNKHEVEFIIVGGYALAFHGAPRFTGDMDIFVRPSPENASRVLEALNEFGFGSADLKKEDFYTPKRVVQLGVPPIRVDMITSLTGVSWEEAFAAKSPGSYGGVPVFFIGRNEFINNKRSMGRKKDLADIEALGEE